MAPPSIGRSATSAPAIRLEQLALPTWAHPEVAYWTPVWRTIRDVCDGERAIKDAGTAYLPQLDGMESDEYAAYIDRATFYGFTERTASALSGSIFRRQGSLEGLPENLVKKLEDVTKDRQDFDTFATMVAEEVIRIGRHGVLLDLPAGESTEPRPYFCTYNAENILDWEEQEVNGRMQLVRVVLREGKLVRDPGTMKPHLAPVYRELILLNAGLPSAEYQQKVHYSTKWGDQVDLAGAYLQETIVPKNRGNSLDFIPFLIIGPLKSTAAVEKPPMEDIARLNISHYRSYAHLEHGRLYTGFPIYYVNQAATGEDVGEFTLGASRVWVAPPDCKPGILEMNGQGLKFLVDALDIKEQQAASLGGRMMGVRAVATTESDNMLKLSERNEQSMLLKITRALDAAFTRLLRWWATLQDVTADRASQIFVKLNKDFLFEGVGAREFRAVHAMYKDGVVPIEVLYHYLKKGYIVPDWMSLEEFKELLDDMDSFPNNPDVEARREGYADAAARDRKELHDDALENELDLEDQAAANALKQQRDQNKFQERQQRRQQQFVRSQPKPAAPGQPGGRPAPGAPKPAPKKPE
jgi:hypothetical protein